MGGWAGGGAGGGAAIAVGTFAGNGADDRAITTGLSSPPKLVQVVAVEANLSAYKYSNFPAKEHATFAGGYQALANGIAISGNNFTVDDTTVGLNGVGTNYYWVAIG